MTTDDTPDVRTQLLFDLRVESVDALVQLWPELGVIPNRSAYLYTEDQPSACLVGLLAVRGPEMTLPQVKENRPAFEARSAAIRNHPLLTYEDLRGFEHGFTYYRDACTPTSCNVAHDAQENPRLAATLELAADVAKRVFAKEATQ